jgi:hypothetical protein
MDVGRGASEFVAIGLRMDRARNECAYHESKASGSSPGAPNRRDCAIRDSCDESAREFELV